MTDTPNSRREFLRRSAILIPAVSLGGYSTTQLVTPTPAQAAVTEEKPQHTAKAYEPGFFTAAEWQFINAACAVIIPEDEEGPGAVSVGVPEFLDRQMETPYAYGRLWYMQGPFITDQPAEMGFQLKLVPREIYRLGIAKTDAFCQTTHGKRFAELPEALQVATLSALEKGQIKFDNLPADTFFTLLLKNVKEGYFADPKYGGNQNMAAWKMLGFPGARADFMDWVDRPNERYPLGPVSINGLKG